ncbi:NAD(P)/FAD-dependent oxidoreductase [bacterium]|nr:NAD(P)/FAD-dependent oxidoreductase [bacterium]
MTGNNEQRVCVIGGGISGMTAAWELAKHDVKVDLYERSTELGGLAGWFNVSGTSVEKFYHHLYNLDVDLIQLINETGLGGNIVFRKTNTGAFYLNKIYRLSSPLDLLKYKPLPFFDRIRMGLLILKAKKEKDWRKLDQITAVEWLIKNSSQKVYDIVWEPLFRSKFGRYAGEVSAAWLWSKLVQRGGSRSKGGAEELGYLKGGYGLLFSELEKKLKSRGVRIFCGSPVESILSENNDKTNNRVTGVRVKGKNIQYSEVIACTQLPDYLNLSSGLLNDQEKKLSNIGFLGNATLVLRMNKRLSDTYWVNITDPKCPFVGVIEQTNLLDESHYGGNHLAYISRYMDVEDPLYSMDKEEFFGTYYPWIKKVFPKFNREWVKEIMLWRDPNSQAVVSVGYSDHIPAMTSSVRGLYLSTMAQIFPEDRQMSNGVKFAKQAAALVLEKSV